MAANRCEWRTTVPLSEGKQGRQMKVSDSCRDLFPCDLSGCWICVAEVERLLKVTAEAWGWVLDCPITKLLGPVSSQVVGREGQSC